MEPDQKTGALRDPVNGHFLPGGPGGPGLPKGYGCTRRIYDLKKIATEQAAKRGLDLDEVLWAVLVAMAAKAKGGDVAAAKLLFDKLCELDPVRMELTADVTQTNKGEGPPVPDGRKFADYLRELRDVSRTLNEASLDADIVDELLR